MSTDTPHGVAMRFYGRYLNPLTPRELDQGRDAWRRLGREDQLFVVAHLGLLQLRVLDDIADAVDACLERVSVPSTPLEGATSWPEEDAPTEEIPVSQLSNSGPDVDGKP